MYTFNIEFEDADGTNIYLAWSNLTLKQAKEMHDAMNKYNQEISQLKLKQFGWEEM